MTSKGEDYITKLERTINKMNDSTLTQSQPKFENYKELQQHEYCLFESHY
jgi:hypothetical protein